MNRPPAFQLYTGDFLADGNVAVMNTTEIGAYCLLIFYCWQEDGLREEDLAKYARQSPARFRKMWISRLSRCFVKREDGKLDHPRLTKERERQRQWREKSAMGGKKSALLKKGGITTVDRVVQPDGNTSSSSSSSSSSSKEEETATAVATIKDLDSFLLQQWGRDGNQPYSVKTQLIDLARKHGFDKLDYAIREAANHNARSLAYVKAILEPKDKTNSELQRFIEGGKK